VMAAWMVAGVGMLLWLRSRNPQAVTAMTHIHLDDEAIAPMAAESTPAEAGEAA